MGTGCSQERDAQTAMHSCAAERDQDPLPGCSHEPPPASVAPSRHSGYRCVREYAALRDKSAITERPCPCERVPELNDQFTSRLPGFPVFRLKKPKVSKPLCGGRFNCQSRFTGQRASARDGLVRLAVGVLWVCLSS